MSEFTSVLWYTLTSRRSAEYQNSLLYTVCADRNPDKPHYPCVAMQVEIVVASKILCSINPTQLMKPFEDSGKDWVVPIRVVMLI